MICLGHGADDVPPKLFPKPVDKYSQMAQTIIDMLDGSIDTLIAKARLLETVVIIDSQSQLQESNLVEQPHFTSGGLSKKIQ
jgi:hypothetical protein